MYTSAYCMIALWQNEFQWTELNEGRAVHICLLFHTASVLIRNLFSYSNSFGSACTASLQYLNTHSVLWTQLGCLWLLWDSIPITNRQHQPATDGATTEVSNSYIGIMLRRTAKIVYFIYKYETFINATLEFHRWTANENISRNCSEAQSLYTRPLSLSSYSSLSHTR
jgi:hypothetical protein